MSAELRRRVDHEIQRLIDDLDDARADGVVYTYGMVQQRLVQILNGGTN